ncbi:MAG: hypothetical protein RLP44_05965 [Aggregatilineales bacterium]
MAFITLNLNEKIEGSSFETETEARAYCRKAYSPLLLIFEASWDDVYHNLKQPVAIYLNGKGYNTVEIEKDVPYVTYVVNKSRLPQSPDFEAIISGEMTHSEVQDALESAFKNGKKLVWIIHEDLRIINAHTSDKRNQFWMKSGDDEINGGEVAPDFSVKVTELFDEVIVE